MRPMATRKRNIHTRSTAETILIVLSTITIVLMTTLTIAVFLGY